MLFSETGKSFFGRFEICKQKFLLILGGKHFQGCDKMKRVGFEPTLRRITVQIIPKRDAITTRPPLRVFYESECKRNIYIPSYYAYKFTPF